jgi:hypothetical protein
MASRYRTSRFGLRWRGCHQHDGERDQFPREGHEGNPRPGYARVSTDGQSVAAQSPSRPAQDARRCSTNGRGMKVAMIALLLLQYTAMAGAQTLVPPEVVRSENVRIDGDVKIVTVANPQRHYTLFCNVTAAGCITPERGKNYLLFDTSTRWKMPGAKDVLTLAFVQDWTVKYYEGENIGLVPEDGTTALADGKSDLGMFMLDRTDGGYERDTIATDGPIIYGTDMSDVDRQKAWKHFFLQMVEAVASQHRFQQLQPWQSSVVASATPKCSSTRRNADQGSDDQGIGDEGASLHYGGQKRYQICHPRVAPCYG